MVIAREEISCADLFIWRATVSRVELHISIMEILAKVRTFGSQNVFISTHIA